MFEDRNKPSLVFLFAWILLTAVGGTLSLPNIVSPRLEAVARQALASDPSLTSLTPHFHGLKGWFSGTVSSADLLEKAYALAEPALPAGSFRRQPVEDFLPAPATLPDEPASPPPSPPAPALPAPVSLAAADSPPVDTSKSEPLIATSATPPAPETPPAPAPVPAPPATAPASEPGDLPDVASIPGSRPLVYIPEEWADDSAAKMPAAQPPPPAPAPASSDAAAEKHEWTGTVFFEPNSSTLHDSQLPILRRIAADSHSRTGSRLRILSFADPRGDPEFNTWLSRRRSERIRAELAQLGIDLEVEVAVDREPETSPILENPGIQRRVELHYVK